MKQAYLIMAHNNFSILEVLIKSIDYKFNDIYIHIDKKVKDFDFDYYSKIPKYSNIYFTKRIDVRWGDFSQIKCELILLEEASKNNNYKYYHLLSGSDILIKKCSDIYNFFDKQDKEFIQYWNYDEIGERINRINYYYLFSGNIRYGNKFSKWINNKLYWNLLRVQKKLNITRLKKYDNFRSGANWFSITDDLVRYVLSLKKEISKTYKHTRCADEIFLQTIVYNSKFYDNLYLIKKDSPECIMRLIDWERGDPYTFNIDDFEEIISSKMFFVRKINDINLAKKIYNKNMR